MASRRVGFCLSVKKRRRMNLSAFAHLCAGRGIEVVEVALLSFLCSLSQTPAQHLNSRPPPTPTPHTFTRNHIDLSQPIESQGPFDIIVHKLSDVIVEAEHDSQSQQFLDKFQSYVSKHPHIVLLDPLPAMKQLLDRFASYRIISNLQNTLRGKSISCPPYLEINTTDMSAIHEAVDRKQLTYPLICKTRVAHGSRSHEMSIIFNQASLTDARPPCVLQSFVNHGAVLHKVFVVGEQHFIVERPSLKNFPTGPYDRKTIFFNSHEVSKPESCSHLTTVDETMPRVPAPSDDAMVAMVKELREELGMALFGVDIIMNIDTHTLTIIDINIFPGYEGVPQFFNSLLSHIEYLLDTSHDTKHRNTANP